MENGELLEGDLKKNLLKLSFPTMIGYFLQYVYDIIDMMWVGRISSSAVAGITIFSTIFLLVTVLNEIIGTSSISLISQSYGMGNKKRTQKIVEQTLTFKALVAFIAAGIMVISLKPLLSYFTKDDIVIKAALDFGYIRIFFLPITFSSYSVNTALRCLGDSKTPMYIMIVGAVTNIILDPFLMFKTVPGTSIPGLNMGVFGAAVATVISTSIAFLLGFYILLKGKKKLKISVKGLFKLDWNIDKKLLAIGIPSGLQIFSRNFAGVLALKFASLYGTDAVAAMGIGAKLLNFCFMPVSGIAISSSTIIGQCLGGECVEKAEETVKFSVKFNLIMMILVSVVAIIFPENIMKLFISDKNVIEIGILMIRIIIPSLIFGGISMGISSAFSGSGYNIPYLVSSFISRWLVQVPMLFIVTNLLQLPIIFLWISFMVTDISEMFIIILLYKNGKWKTKRV